MVIIGNRNGRLANRLFHFSHFLSNAYEYKYTLYYPFFKEYYKFFELNDSSAILDIEYLPKAPNTNLILRRTIQRIIQLLISLKLTNNPVYRIIIPFPKSTFDLSNHDFIKESKFKIVIPYGFAFRDYYSFNKHQDLIRKYFKLNEPYLSNVRNTTSNKDKRKKLIGIHMRKGDYKNWRSGKYYYEDEKYVTILYQIEKLFSEEICFLICSDQKIDLVKFKQFDIKICAGSAVEDLYSLANCDYIVGPPSTYSAWASFYGLKPIYHIYDPEHKISISDFKVFEEKPNNYVL